ncbi:unnamed protein product [Clonostachys rosea f. rosea IK726]|uniref:Uncharacterized protein n=2 Tax=Bionectria ochroleuca TaxID=29856 RepID=A0A0B7JSK8_BIOOC|nr:unnamed protein product [Clonostachys rosea f. rosea IK726]
MPAIHILDLPGEIVDNILQQAILVRVLPIGDYESLTGIPRVLRLRLVCKSFDAIFRPALFATRIFDTYLPVSTYQPTQALRYWPIRNNHGAQQLWHAYLVYRVQNETEPLAHRYVEIRTAAERLFNTNLTGLTLQSIIESVCWLALASVAGKIALKTYNDHFVIKNGADLNLLSAAAYLNCQDVVKRLLAEGIDPTQHDDLLPAAIEAAALAGHADMLQILQESLPDMVRPPADRETNPRGFIGHATLPTVLCKGKADPQAVVGAAMNGDVELLKMALYPPSRRDPRSTDYFEQPHGKVKERSLPGLTLRAAMLHSKSLNVYRILSDFFAQSTELFPACQRLDRYCEFGNLEIVKHLLDTGVSVNIEPGMRAEHPSALHEACRHGHEAIVDLLIERGARINQHCGRFETPLYAAVSGGFITIAQNLINKGAECDLKFLKNSLSSEYPAMTRLLLPHLSAEEVYKNLHYLTDDERLDKMPLLALIGEHPGLSFKNGKVRPPVPPKAESLSNPKLRREGRKHGNFGLRESSKFEDWLRMRYGAV